MVDEIAELTNKNRIYRLTWNIGELTMISDWNSVFCEKEERILSGENIPGEALMCGTICASLHKTIQACQSGCLRSWQSKGAKKNPKNLLFTPKMQS